MRPLLCSAGLIACIAAAPALAADYKPGPLIATACAKDPPLTIRDRDGNVRALTDREKSEWVRARLAEALLAQYGVLGSDLFNAQLPGDLTYDQRAINAAASGALNGADIAGLADMRNTLEQHLLEMALLPEDKRTIRLTDAPPLGSQIDWLFEANSPVGLQCVNRKAPTPDDWAAPPEYAQWALREKVDELGLTGEEARAAGAARVGLQRVRTEKDDGSTKSSTTLSLNGTLGIRVAPISVATPVYAFASYALSRERTKDADPGTDQSDGDINALELGVSFADLGLGDHLASVRASWIGDFAKDSRRVKLAGSFAPGLSGPIGLCGLGSYSPIGDIERIQGRCVFVLEGEGSHVFDAGTADFKVRGNYAALGGRASYELGLVGTATTDVVASVSFRYLPTIFGQAPNIKRWDAALKYRLWTESGIGLDFGLSWAKGHEPISLQKEDRIQLGFGIVR